MELAWIKAKHQHNPNIQMKRKKNKSSKQQFQTYFHMKSGSHLKEVDPSSSDFSGNDTCFFYVIAKEEIEACDTARLLQDLRPEPANPFLMAGPGSVIFSVSDYDDDPRDLVQIPEVSAYFRKVQQQAPCWLYFAMPGSGWLRTVLAGSAIGFRYAEQDGQLLIDIPQDEIIEFMRLQIKECASLCMMMNVDPDVVKEHLHAAMGDISPGLLPRS